jgi:hypothetical protein
VQLLGKITVCNFWTLDRNFGSENPYLYSYDNCGPRFCFSIRNFVNFPLFLLFRDPSSFAVHGFEIVIHDLVPSLQILIFPTPIVQEISQTPYCAGYVINRSIGSSIDNFSNFSFIIKSIMSTLQKLP